MADPSVATYPPNGLAAPGDRRRRWALRVQHQGALIALVVAALFLLLSATFIWRVRKAR